MIADYFKLRTACAALAAIALYGLAGIAPGLAFEVVPGERHCVTGVAHNDVLNIRARPSVRSAVVGIAKPDACDVTVDRECSGRWCPVRTPTTTGWARRDYLGMVSPARYCVVDVRRNDKLNVRTGPSTGYPIIAALKPDQCGIALAPPYRDGQWTRVVLPGRRAVGWVHGRYLSGQ